MSDEDTRRRMREIERLNNMKTPEEYIRDMRLYGDIPRDQYSHSFKLLFHPLSPPDSQMDLLPPDAILGLVKDSKTLRFLQNDNELLNRLYDMGLRNKGVMQVFDSLYYSWWQKLRMTGMLGGTERKLQSFMEPGEIPYESFSFVEKIREKKKKKKKEKTNL